MKLSSILSRIEALSQINVIKDDEDSVKFLFTTFNRAIESLSVLIQPQSSEKNIFFNSKLADDCILSEEECGSYNFSQTTEKQNKFDDISRIKLRSDNINWLSDWQCVSFTDGRNNVQTAFRLIYNLKDYYNLLSTENETVSASLLATEEKIIPLQYLSCFRTVFYITEESGEINTKLVFENHDNSLFRTVSVKDLKIIIDYKNKTLKLKNTGLSTLNININISSWLYLSNANIIFVYNNVIFTSSQVKRLEMNVFIHTRPVVDFTSQMDNILEPFIEYLIFKCSSIRSLEKRGINEMISKGLEKYTQEAINLNAIKIFSQKTFERNRLPPSNPVFNLGFDFNDNFRSY